MRATTEEQQISHVLERLVAQYPNRDPKDVAHAVENVRKRFEESPIRDFVPLLVERHVRAEFNAQGPSPRQLTERSSLTAAPVAAAPEE